MFCLLTLGEMGGGRLAVAVQLDQISTAAGAAFGGAPTPIIFLTPSGGGSGSSGVAAR
jgi:hypothetical protein